MPSLPADNLLPDCTAALAAAEAFLAKAKQAVGRPQAKSRGADDAEAAGGQFALHGFAWIATYVTALRQLLAWAERLDAQDKLGALETLILQAAFGEYLAQLAGGIAMSQGEVVRPADLGIERRAVEAFTTPAVRRLIDGGNTEAVRTRIATLLAADAGGFGDTGLDDETLVLMRDQFRRFVADKIQPHAQGWHLADVLIPDSVVEALAGLGVFGLTVPERWGGAGLGKLAMCVVSETLSQGALAVGSFGTRSEIAAELIRSGGTPEQQEKYLAKIASGAILPTAMFTEPNTGSDLGAVRTRAVRGRGKDGRDVYRISGAKTWATHAARADLMTLLVRTDGAAAGYKGLSMLLAEKPRGTAADPFPAAGMQGSEIQVLGYRGMKEYEIAFDGFEVPAAALLGGVEGQGFKQLMATFESARIQTASRAVGVAESALALALRYAHDRVQFGRPILAFPRVSGKIAWMAVETMVARQLTYFAAREKDSGRRCDIEAGMAKLLAARVAWANADNAVQVHGGVGYAVEFPVSRVLVDARILSIFEGAAEIQAQIIAKGLLEGRN